MNNIERIRQKHEQKQKITMLTAYDCLTAAILERAGVDIILVGDSLGNAFQGNKTTASVALSDMVYHTKAVRNGAPGSLVVTDMPAGTYSNNKDALKNAKALLQAGADCVKIEGNPQNAVAALVSGGIEVMGHTGLLPQTAATFSVQGKKAEEARNILELSRHIQRQGAFAIVIECVAEDLAKQISSELAIPTIGIGSGIHTSGQVLVISDLLNLSPDKKPKFVKSYTDLNTIIQGAVKGFIQDVESGIFPDHEHTYH